MAPPDKPLKVVVFCHVVPLILYWIVAPNGEVTRIVPVFTTQVGCVNVAAGVAGAFGNGLIVKLAVVTQFGILTDLTLTVYVEF